MGCTMSVKEWWDNCHKTNNEKYLTGTNLESYKIHYQLSNEDIDNADVFLEVGIGLGTAIRDLHIKSKTVYAVDISEEALAKVGDVAITYNINDIAELPTNTIDIAFCHLVFQHTDKKNIEVIIENVLKSLSMDGKFCIQFADAPGRNEESDLCKEKGGMLYSRDEILEIVYRCNGKILWEPAIQKFDFTQAWWHKIVLRKV